MVFLCREAVQGHIGVELEHIFVQLVVLLQRDSRHRANTWATSPVKKRRNESVFANGILWFFFFYIPSCVSKGCLGSIQEKTVFPDWGDVYPIPSRITTAHIKLSLWRLITHMFNSWIQDGSSLIKSIKEQIIKPRLIRNSSGEPVKAGMNRWGVFYASGVLLERWAGW